MKEFFEYCKNIFNIYKYNILLLIFVFVCIQFFITSRYMGYIVESIYYTYKFNATYFSKYLPVFLIIICVILATSLLAYFLSKLIKLRKKFNYQLGRLDKFADNETVADHSNNNTGIDEPLQTLEDIKKIDAGSGAFAKYITDVENFVQQLTNLTKATICIDAGWGVGKTSFINIAKDIYKKDPGSKAKTVWIDYNPWHFGNSTELIKDFFETLNQEVYDKFCINLLPNRELQNYVSLITPAVEDLGFWGKLATGIINSIFGTPTLQNTKNKLKENLTKFKGKIIVVLDDIDRMEPKEVLTTIKLVKLLADFDNIIFILPFDYQRVSTVITKHFGETYADYLQKIINKNIKLENYTYEQLFNIFKSKLSNKNSLQKIFDVYILSINSIKAKLALESNHKTKTGDLSFTNEIFININSLNDLLQITSNFRQLWIENGNMDTQGSLRKDFLTLHQYIFDNKLELENLVYMILGISAKMDLLSSKLIEDTIDNQLRFEYKDIKFDNSIIRRDFSNFSTNIGAINFSDFIKEQAKDKLKKYLNLETLNSINIARGFQIRNWLVANIVKSRDLVQLAAKLNGVDSVEKDEVWKPIVEEFAKTVDIR